MSNLELTFYLEKEAMKTLLTTFFLLASSPAIASERSATCVSLTNELDEISSKVVECSISNRCSHGRMKHYDTVIGNLGQLIRHNCKSESSEKDDTCTTLDKDLTRLSAKQSLCIKNNNCSPEVEKITEDKIDSVYSDLKANGCASFSNKD